MKEDPLAEWRRWLVELDDHPLDRFEYETALWGRDLLTEELEIIGDEALHDRLDELDVWFEDLTVEVAAPLAPRSWSGPSDVDDRRGWWWDRLPADPDARAYLDH